MPLVSSIELVPRAIRDSGSKEVVATARSGLVGGWGVSKESPDFDPNPNPNGKYDDLPLCQVYQIPTPAMRLAEMPKTIWMTVSSCMVMCHRVLLNDGVERSSHYCSAAAR